MADDNLRQVRVLHIVSSGGVGALNQTLFMPLLTRMPKERVKAQVVCLSPGAAACDVLRLNGVPAHDVALSRQRFSMLGVSEVLRAAKQFRPDVIQAWGHTAQIVAARVRQRCDWKPKLVWSVVNTAPLARDAGFIDRQKLNLLAKLSGKPDRIVYCSEAGASQHRRVGFPDGGHLAIPPGVDAMRFKPDAAARRKVREQLELSPQAFVIGMAAPFQPEYDHATLLKAMGELIKTNPDIALVLAGHGVQKGNGPLMAIVGGGVLGARTHLLGEWSDLASLFNACDIVCSSALTDDACMTLVKAMLCGVPCVATGMAAQGEVLGKHGVAIEPGSPAAFVKGVTRIMEMTPEKRAQMVQGARKHALREFVYVHSLQKYLQLYCDLIGREALAETAPATQGDEAIAADSPAQAIAAVESEAQPQSETPAATPLEASAVDPEEAAAASVQAINDAAAPEKDAADAPTTQVKADPAPILELALQPTKGQNAQHAAKPGAHRQTPVSCEATDIFKAFDLSAASDSMGSTIAEPARSDDEFEDLLAPEDLESDAPFVERTPSPQTRPAATPVSADGEREDAMARMRAAARKELQRAAAMSAPVKATAVAKSAAQAAEFQLELLPEAEAKRCAR